MVSNDLSSGHWGKFTRQTMESGGVIKLNRDIFYDEEKAEGVLCHEVIHMITTGLNYIEYRESNRRVEIVLPDKANVRAGYKKYIYDDGTSETKILTYNELSYNNFFKEGLTELLMNQMYSREEASYTYTANTHFIQTLNTLVGCSLLDSFKSFLQGDLDIYREYFGKEQYDLLEEYLAEHMKDLDASHSNNSVHLQKAYGLVVNKAVEVGIKEGKSISEIMMRLNEVTSKMINVEPATLFENIREPLVNYFKDTISNKDRYVSRVESLIERWCDIKCAYIDSYSNRNINIGYKLQGFSENIGFRYSRYNNSLNLMVVSHGMDMTAFYFPEEVGRKYRMPCRDGIDTLTMYRDSENSVIYTQGDLERRLVFDNKGQWY